MVAFSPSIFSASVWVNKAVSDFVCETTSAVVETVDGVGVVVEGGVDSASGLVGLEQARSRKRVKGRREDRKRMSDEFVGMKVGMDKVKFDTDYAINNYRDE